MDGWWQCCPINYTWNKCLRESERVSELAENVVCVCVIRIVCQKSFSVSLPLSFRFVLMVVVVIAYKFWLCCMLYVLFFFLFSLFSFSLWNALLFCWLCVLTALCRLLYVDGHLREYVFESYEKRKRTFICVYSSEYVNWENAIKFNFSSFHWQIKSEFFFNKSLKI